jgi:hypothetical protein
MLVISLKMQIREKNFETYGPLRLPILIKSSMSKGSFPSSGLFFMNSAGKCHSCSIYVLLMIEIYLEYKEKLSCKRWTREVSWIKQKYSTSIEPILFFKALRKALHLKRHLQE